MMRFRSVTVCMSLLAVAPAASAAVNVIPCPKEVAERGGFHAAPADFFEHAAERWTKDATLPATAYAVEDGTMVFWTDGKPEFKKLNPKRNVHRFTRTDGVWKKETVGVK